MKVLFLYTSIVLWFCITISLPAQPGLVFETTGGYTNNVFHNYKTLDDYYSHLNAYLHYDRIDEKHGIRTYYNGSLTSYDRYTDKNYHNHSLGVSWYMLPGTNGNRFDAGISISKRLHSETYHWFELETGSVYLNSKIVLNEQLYSYVGFNLTSRRYDNLSAFSHWQAVVFARLSKFFATGTTVIVESDIINKQYFPLDSETPSAIFPEIVTVGDGSSISSVLLLRLAQGITPKTGLGLQLQGRKNFSNTTRYLGNLDGYYYSDEEMFDDMFGYNEEKIALTLTQRLPWKSKLVFQNSLQWKNYTNRLAFDLEGNPLGNEQMRRDKRWVMDITLEKSTRLSRSVDPLTLSVSWSVVNNHSNDPYYDFNNGYMNFNLSASL